MIATKQFIKSKTNLNERGSSNKNLITIAHITLNLNHKHDRNKTVHQSKTNLNERGCKWINTKSQYTTESNATKYTELE
ncbi:hypothetical protein MTR_0026s0190 [Medicago truncatula]|uniref:Uncharacterized protein n=1 Tax=Medicago truncatula TaxID=3880 RepID=A0A072TJB7_MEDTR|nr:hypothetical protein MTR_0026s0190 [Medicago truncatula]